MAVITPRIPSASLELLECEDAALALAAWMNEEAEIMTIRGSASDLHIRRTAGKVEVLVVGATDNFAATIEHSQS